jgi:hypothetical protein
MPSIATIPSAKRFYCLGGVTHFNLFTMLFRTEGMDLMWPCKDKGEYLLVREVLQEKLNLLTPSLQISILEYCET